jgi:DNA-binding MarR family transcriptional regulator
VRKSVKNKFLVSIPAWHQRFTRPRGETNGALRYARNWPIEPAGDRTNQLLHQVPMSDLTSMPGHLIRRVHQISMAIFAEECAASGLTSVQFAALTAIRKNPDVDATRLSSLIAFDRSTLGDVLERLEAKGWILRSPSPHDKRVRLLNLSPAGSKVLDGAEPEVRRVQQRLLEPLDPDERIEMMRMLAQLIRLHENFSPHPAER